MPAPPHINEVLNAKSSTTGIHFNVVNNFFSSTWSASYVRLVELEPDDIFSIPLLLAYALWNDPSAPEYAPEEWLPNVSLRDREISTVRETISSAITDLEQSDDNTGVLATRLRALSATEATNIYELDGVPGGARPAAPRRYGPTYQIMWQDKWRYYFLEVHNES